MPAMTLRVPAGRKPRNIEMSVRAFFAVIAIAGRDDIPLRPDERAELVRIALHIWRHKVEPNLISVH